MRTNHRSGGRLVLLLLLAAVVALSRAGVGKNVSDRDGNDAGLPGFLPERP